MLISSVFTALFTICAVFLLNYSIKKDYIKVNINILPFFAFLAIVLRIYLAYTNLGHKTDMNCFSVWADMLYKNGFKAFYASDTFTDYPPGYMYILRIVGFIKNLYPFTKGVESVIVKLPAMIFDIVMGFVVYSATKKTYSHQKAQLLAILMFFNPLSIINSAVWGQVDSIYLVFVSLSLLYLAKKRLILSFVIFSVAIIFKPQALIFTPVFLFSSYEYIKEHKKAGFIKILSGIILLAILMLIMIIPVGIKNTFIQYTKTLASYPYASVNAFNIWGLFGMNWHELNLPLTLIGYAFIIIATVFSGVIYFKTDSFAKYFVSASFLCFSVYMLSVKMHERYAYCAIALMLLAFCFSKERKHFLLSLLLGISQVINVSWIYFIYEKNPTVHYQSTFIIIASFINLLLLIYMTYLCLTKKDSSLFSPSKIKMPKINSSSPLVTRKDIIAIVIITLAYSSVALYNLGDTKSCKTEYTLNANEQFKVSFDEEYEISKFCLFNKNVPVDDKNTLTFSFFDEDNKPTSSITLDDCNVFSWNFSVLENTKAKHIIITTKKETTLCEVAFFNPDSNLISPASATSLELFDEQSLVPKSRTNLNSTYFDEIYHARTAYEYIEGLPVYEWTHPPLGKIFISIGIRLFGMNPFGWRIVGTFFGILMVPFIYLFSKKIFKKTWLSCVLCIIFSFDFMHFVQTRIATIDVYITLFVILMYYYMYSYYNMDFYNTKISKTFIPLLFSGISFGLGVASKWTGVYAGAGLCVIFFITLHKRYKEYLLSLENQNTDIAHKIISSFKKNTAYTLIFCVFAFVFIPLLIYAISYIPFVKCEGGSLSSIIKNQTDMFYYHSRTVLSSTHPFSSRWYEWIIMKRPIWYYSNTISQNLKEGISAFGNPLVWWLGIPCVIFTLYEAVIKKEKKAIFLITAYLAQLVPWIFVERVVFIYHYFPCIPFLVLIIGYAINELYKKTKFVKYLSFLYTLAVVMLFTLFYPVLSGIAVNPDWVNRFLEWFSTWTLI